MAVRHLKEGNDGCACHPRYRSMNATLRFEDVTCGNCKRSGRYLYWLEYPEILKLFPKSRPPQ